VERDEFKQAFLELLDSDWKKGRKWFFPKNVDNQYIVIANMTLKDLGTFIVPSFAVSFGVASIPPYHSVALWLIKAFLIVFIIVIPLAYVTYRPIKYRDNIRSKDFVKEYIDYYKKPKVYFVKPKNNFRSGYIE